MIKQIKFVSIPVHDQSRALAFYTDKLGFTIMTDQPFDGKQRWIELRIPKAETRFVLFTPDEHKGRIGSFTGVSLECDDIDATYSELLAKGVVFDAPPARSNRGAPSSRSRTARATAFVCSPAPSNSARWSPCVARVSGPHDGKG